MQVLINDKCHIILIFAEIYNPLNNLIFKLTQKDKKAKKSFYPMWFICYSQAKYQCMKKNNETAQDSDNN